MENQLLFIIQLAQQAGDLLLQHFSQANLNTRLKNDRTVVTEADLAVDRLIAREIQARFPDDLILSEELQPVLPDRFEEAGERSLWIIDPLDGTTNFSLGLPHWGVLITRLASGLPEATALYFPMLEELYTAGAEMGAYLNSQPIRAEGKMPNLPITFFACCSNTYKRYQVSIPYKTRILGSGGYDFCSVARGIARVGFEAKAKIWDLAGGWLLVKEAGGAVDTLNSRQIFPPAPGINYNHQDFPILFAASQEALDRARTQLIPKV